MADDTVTEDDADNDARIEENDICAYAPDYVLQRTNAFLAVTLTYDQIPDALKPEAQALLGVIMRSIRTYSDKGEVSKLRTVKPA